MMMKRIDECKSLDSGERLPCQKLYVMYRLSIFISEGIVVNKIQGRHDSANE